MPYETVPDDALALLGISPPKDALPQPPLLPESEQKIWDAIADGFVSTDALPAATNLSIAPEVSTVDPNITIFPSA